MTWEDVEQFANRYRLRECAVAVFILFSVVLFAATHWPNPPEVDIASYKPSDKVQHFAGYFVFTILLGTALRLLRWPIWQRLGQINLQGCCLVLAVLVCGALDELTQPAFGRQCSIFDLAADLLGAIAGAILCAMFDVGAKIARRYRWSRYEPLESLSRN